MIRFRLTLALLAPVPALAAPALHTDDLVGVGLRIGPAHAGASHRETRAVPILAIERGPWIVRTTQGVPEAAVVFEPVRGVKAGLALTLDERRRSADVAAFAGRSVPDLDGGPALGPIVEANFAVGPVPARLTWRWRQSLQREHGASSDLRLAAGLFDGQQLRLQGYVQTTWSDATARTLGFGLPASSATASGLSAASFASGGRDAVFGLALRWDVSDPWSWVASVEWRRVSGALSAGPVVETGSASAATLGVVYRFR